MAICLYAADRHPEAHLIPPLGTIERPKVYRWSVFALTELQASLARARLLQDVHGERHEAAKANLAEALAALETSRVVSVMGGPCPAPRSRVDR